MTNKICRKPDIKLFYKYVDGIKLPMNIYLPKEINDHLSAVVCIHGGGWKVGIYNNNPWNGCHMKWQAQHFTNHGCIGIEISYRSVLLGDITVYDILEDCKDAMRYIRSNLHMVNFDNLSVIGDSAGAHLATMLGISQDDEIRPKRVIACNPVIDCSAFAYAFNGTNSQNATPTNYSPEKCADFLFMHGTADTVVDIKQTEKLHNKLKALDKNSEFIAIPDAQHAFILYDYQNTDEYVDSIMEKADRFLGII